MKRTNPAKQPQVKKPRAQVGALKQPKTTRQWAEEALSSAPKKHQQRQAEISALLEGSRAVLKYREFKDAARSIFDSCKKTTGATGGYVAMTSEDGTGNDLLFIDPGGRACTVDRSLPMPIRGLRGEAYRTGKAVYHNDFAKSEWVEFVPAGHVRLDNVLFAPLIIEGKTVGLLGLANKPGGFTENDARIASTFGELAAIALLNSRTLEALKHSEERFRAVVRSASDAIISADSQGRIVFWNNAAQAIFGWPADEMIGKPVTEIMPEHYRADHQARMQRLITTGEARVLGRTVELAGLRRDGSEIPVELSLASWRIREDTFFTAIIRDITERKRAGEEYRTIISTAMDGFWITDIQGRFWDVNDAYCHLIGYSRGELLKMGVQHVEAAEKPEETAQHIQKLIEIGYDRFETQHRCKDGRIVDIEASANFVPSHGGRFYVFLRDITARKQVEEEIRKLNAGLEQRVIERTAQLRESETRYRIVADNTYDWEFWLSPEGQFIYTSPSCERITGHTPEEFTADPDLLFRIIHPDDRPRWNEHRCETAQGKIKDEIEFRVLRSDGTARWIGHACQPVFDDAGRFIGTRGSNRDITERKGTEEEIQRNYDTQTVLNTLLRLSLEDISLDEILKRALDLVLSIPWLASQSRGSIALVEDTPDVLVMKAQNNLAEPIQKACARVSFGKCLCGRAASMEEVQFADCLDDRHEIRYEGITPHGHYCVPILYAGRTLGVINIYLKTGHYSDQREVNFLTGIASTLAGIIQRKQVEEALLAERGLFIGGTTVVFKWRAQEGWPVEYVSPNLTSQFGYRPEDLTTGKFRYAAIVHPDDLTRVGEEVVVYSQTNASCFEQEYRIARADGQYRWVDDFTVVIRDQHGAITHYHGYLVDITERKRAEQDLRHRLVELEAVNKISTALRVAQTLDEMLPRLLDETLAALGTDAGILWLYDVAREEIHEAVSRGWFKQIAEETPIKMEGIAAHVLATDEAYVTREFVSDPHTREDIRSQIPAGWGGASVPIHSAQESVGVLFVAVPLPREISPGDMRLLTTLAEIAGNAIHRMRLHAQTEQRLQRLVALHTTDQAISASIDLRLTLNVLLDQVTTQLRVDAAAVLLLNPHMQTLEYAAGRGFRSQAIERFRLRLGECLGGRAALERQIVNIPDLPKSGSVFARANLLAGENFIAYYGVPLVAKGNIKGVMEIFHRSPLAPDSDWLSFLETLAGQAAIAIDNITLFNDLQNSNINLTLAYDATIEGWSRALDMRDKETEGHTQRVAEMTERLARAMGMSEAELAHVRRGALLHDIGKMGVPDGILLKPGPLTDEEWVEMRKHPVYAYEMLSPIAYLRPALDIPYCHHEKWDGTGYPRGLKGEQTPIAARLFALVDVWDAMCSERPYRPALPKETVRDHIRSQIGTHFDPKLVEVFLKVVAGE